MDRYLDPFYGDKRMADEQFLGTTKATFHIPNYTGFIPEAKMFSKALPHAWSM